MTTATQENKAETARIESLKRLRAIQPSRACPEIRDATMIKLVRSEVVLKQTIERLLDRSIQLAHLDVCELKAIWARYHYAGKRTKFRRAQLIEHILHYEFPSNEDDDE